MVVKGSTRMTPSMPKRALTVLTKFKAISKKFHRPDASRAARAVSLCLVVALGGGLSGCSSESSGDWDVLYKIVSQSWERRNGAVRLDDAAAIPYATLGIRIGDNTEQMLILATDSAGSRIWTSGARVALTTRAGRIVATAGLAQNLSSYGSATAFQPSWLVARHVAWTADFADLGLYGVQIDCNDTPAGEENIVILGQSFDTIRVDEACESNQLGWSYTNTYWVSRSSNRVWRSIQHVHPKSDAVEIELLRPPQTDG